MKKTGGFRRFIKILLMCIYPPVVLALFFIGVVFVVDRVKDADEWKQLEEAGYVNLVSVGDYRLNVYRKGSEDAKHTIVSVQGLGTMANAVDLKPLMEQIDESCRFAVIDRAGYGLSDDSDNVQTVNQIVSDYRTALEKSGMQAPYILMAHSVGGVYASYWQMKYPEEIEGVIYLDPTPLGRAKEIESPAQFSEEFWSIQGDGMFVEALGCKLGLDRIFLRPSDSLTGYEEGDRVEDTLLFWSHCPASLCFRSEVMNSYTNISETVDILQPNRIPKLYIDASAHTKEERLADLEEHNRLMTRLGHTDQVIDLNSERAKNLLDEAVMKKYYEDNIKPYVEMLGSVTYKHIPGAHNIHMQNPVQVAAACNEFLKNLEKKS